MKYIFDIFLVVVFFPVFLTTMLLLSLATFINLGRPIFFLQERPGLDGKLFKIIKFRTMKNLDPKQSEVINDEERLTSFGRFIRSTSLDEIPEIINVIKGEMSIVGPRPLLKDYLNLYSEDQMRRHQVKPGITGWAQINGRNNITWEEKFNLDLWYVDNHTLIIDIKIIFLTLIKVLKRKDISELGKATMTKFKGNE